MRCIFTPEVDAVVFRHSQNETVLKIMHNNITYNLKSSSKGNLNMSKHLFELFIFLTKTVASKICQKSAPGYFTGACGHSVDIGEGFPN
jgi:hypothetical protein